MRPDPEPQAPTRVDTLDRRGRGLRVAATLLFTGTLLTGTLVGQDDAFPFGPFRMFSTTDKLDAPVRDTRVDAIDTEGRPQTLTELNTGFRRAEVEGQLTRFRHDPRLLANLAAAYAHRNPRAPAITEISIVVRWHELRGGLPTGATRDETVVTWTS